MKPPLKNYLSTTQQERKSALILIGILILIVFIYIYIHWNPPIPTYTIEAIQPPTIKNGDTASLTTSLSRDDQNEKLVPFNPNEVTWDDLVSFGIPPKTASTWIHFLSKGGRFKNPEDVKKIYGMNGIVYSHISPFIQFNREASTFIASTRETPIPKSIRAIDPNTAQYDDFVQLGLSGKIAHTLINYRSTGKKFSSVSDLSKIYGMNDSIMTSIIPNLVFPVINSGSIQSNSFQNESVSYEPLKTPIDLNVADTSMLKRLPGLGHVLALRIIAYREKLGGFYSIDQLKEVYGLRDTSIIKFQSGLMVSTPYRKIKINQEALTSIYHPYLPKKDALLIQNYRNQHGSFHSVSDLFQLKAFDQKYWQRITPYLDFSTE